MELLINLDVPDLASAQACYCAAFDLRVGRTLDNSAIELLGAAVPLWLLATPEGSDGAAGKPRIFQRHWTPVHLDVIVPLLEPALVRAEAAGMRREGDIREARWGRIISLSDPFGHGWCLLQFVGRGYDEIADPTG